MAEYAAMAFLVIVVVVGVFLLLGISISDLIRPVVNIFSPPKYPKKIPQKFLSFSQSALLARGI